MKALKIIVIILVVIGIVYFIFKDKIDKYIGFAKGLTSPSWVSCKETFFAKLPDGKTISVFKGANIGTADNPSYEFYKNDVTPEGGVENPGNPVKIAKEEYDSLCKYLYNPPYAWYTESKTPDSVHGGRGIKK